MYFDNNAAAMCSYGGRKTGAALAYQQFVNHKALTNVVITFHRKRCATGRPMHIKHALLGLSLVGLLAAAGCTTTDGMSSGRMAPVSAYAAVKDEGVDLPRVPINEVDDKYRRQIVDYKTDEKPGTIVVDTKERLLYYVLEDGKAVRYGVGVGRDGFRWSGTAYIGRRAEWPTWYPPAAMVKRQPELKEFAGGMDAGIMNPLGARALYLYRNGNDTLYRIHGNPNWTSIGQSVSSGCIRMINQDIIDLYARVDPDKRTKVVVLPG
ncbi:lipoprotein-anchoring transpeptidase ErfK/SrfK [Martelella mediterranea]|uniref:Lipoprotein-anchoring transpeptidase ErfK/SrfK n=2 Tax=Martelella mediterranea TaxID=293089 RepID=A0A4R3NX96_9HYPH|nr:lipoprotein-anchoring transpeptidase ErfK/SrfK [Martelella mediterranea]